jgi:hypothetical protein
MLAGTIMRHASASAMVDACGRAVGGIQTFHWSAPSINKVYKHSYIQYVGNDCVADSGMTRERGVGPTYEPAMPQAQEMFAIHGCEKIRIVECARP